MPTPLPVGMGRLVSHTGLDIISETLCPRLHHQRGIVCKTHRGEGFRGGFISVVASIVHSPSHPEQRECLEEQKKSAAGFQARSSDRALDDRGPAGRGVCELAATLSGGLAVDRPELVSAEENVVR